MYTKSRDVDGRPIDDNRWRTPLGLNPLIFYGFPPDHDWSKFDEYFGLKTKTSNEDGQSKVQNKEKKD